MSKAARMVILILVFAAVILLPVSCGGGEEEQQTGISTDITTSGQSVSTDGQPSDKTGNTTVDPTKPVFMIYGLGDVSVEESGSTFRITVPNETDIFSVNDYVETREDVVWEVYYDPEGTTQIRTKRLTLTEGTNTFYVSAFDKNSGALIGNYTLHVMRAGTYTVHFEGVEEVQTVIEGGLAKDFTPKTKPTKTGYEFDGWDYDFEQPITEEITIPVNWKAKKYTITYMMKQITLEDQTQEATYGEETVLLVPECEGFEFIGWTLYNDASDDGTGGEPIGNGVWNIADSVRLVANWEEVHVKYFVTLKPNGGTINGSTDEYIKEVMSGKEETFPTPVLEGSAFLGWFYGEGEDDHFESGKYTFGSDMTFEARWAELSTRITFYENNGKEEYAVVLKYNEQLPVPVRNGFEFDGWYYDMDLTQPVNEVPDNLDSAEMYAGWKGEGKPYEFVYSMSDDLDEWEVSARVDPESKAVVPAYIGGIRTHSTIREPNPNAGIILENGVDTTLTVKVDRTVQIRAVYTPEFEDDDQRLIYTSSNEAIAKVNQSGLVTGVASGLGTCDITVSSVDGKYSAVCHIAVSTEAKNPQAGVHFETTNVQIKVNGTVDPVADYQPEYSDDDRTLIFTSSDPSKATVDNTGKIKGVSLGDCTVTVSTVDGRYKDMCVVHVVEVITNENAGLFLSDAALEMNVGWVKTVIANYTPRAQDDMNKTVYWSSSDPLVATVRNGVITALSEGQCTITATDRHKDFTATVEVTVHASGIFIESEPRTLLSGTMGVFKAYVMPASENGSTEVIYSSSDSDVATVTADGIVIARTKGECDLVAESVDGISVTSHLIVKDIFEMKGDESVTVEQRNKKTWYVTVLTDDFDFLSMSDYVVINSPEYIWKLSHDSEMERIILTRNVSIPNTDENVYYMHLLRADNNAWVATYGLHVSKHVEYTITLDPSGGSVTPAELKVFNGDSFTLPVPVRGGFDFVGWYYGAQIFNKTVYDLAGNITLVAHYDEIVSPTSTPPVTPTPTETPATPTPTETPVIEVEEIVLSTYSIMLEVGGKETLTATAKPDAAADRTLEALITGETVISYENETVTALSAGEARITFTASNGVSAVCVITVNEETTPADGWKLHATKEAGDDYTSSVVFAGEALSTGNQVWISATNAPILFAEMQNTPVVLPNDGTKSSLVDAVAFAKPAYICLCFGATACLDNGYSQSTVTTIYRALIEDILAASPDTVVIVKSALPVGKTRDSAYEAITNKKIDTINGWIADLVHELYDADNAVYFLDCSEYFANNSGNLKTEYDAGDGLSINDKGYLFLLKIISTYAVTLQ